MSASSGGHWRRDLFQPLLMAHASRPLLGCDLFSALLSMRMGRHITAAPCHRAAYGGVEAALSCAQHTTGQESVLSLKSISQCCYQFPTTCGYRPAYVCSLHTFSSCPFSSFLLSRSFTAQSLLQLPLLSNLWSQTLFLPFVVK